MKSGTRPNLQVLVDRGVRLAAGLAAVIAIPVGVLFYFQFRALNDLALVVHLDRPGPRVHGCSVRWLPPRGLAARRSR